MMEINEILVVYYSKAKSNVEWRNVNKNTPQLTQAHLENELINW